MDKLHIQSTSSHKDIFFMDLPVALIFSKDRALQLDLLLTSFFRYCEEARDVRIVILYKTSNPWFDRGYDLLQSKNASKSNIIWVREVHFKKDLVSIIKQHERITRSILFLVDDCIFIDRFNLRTIQNSLFAENSCLSFSLRLGTNTTHCYTRDISQRLPSFIIHGEYLKYTWPSEEGDFGYPLEVSSSVLRIRDILATLNLLPFNSPNRLEQVLAFSRHYWANVRQQVLCHRQSVAFCLPLNRVQNVIKNRYAQDMATHPAQLNRLFVDRVGIPLDQFDGFIPNACHSELSVKMTYPIDYKAGCSIAVLMSFLFSCDYNWLLESVRSTARALSEGDRIFLRIDGGVLTDEQMDELQEIAYPIPMEIDSSRVRLGLATSLNQLIDRVVLQYEFSFVARMDADDICRQSRFKIQRKYMNENPDVAIIGGHCKEFGSVSRYTAVKRMPLSYANIRRVICRRNCINHPSVFIRREVFLSGLRYRTDVGLLEDYFLWVDALLTGWKIENVADVVIDYRVATETYNRRGGLVQAYFNFKVRLKAMKGLNCLSPLNVLVAVLIFLIRLLPGRIQSIFHQYRSNL